MYRLVILISNIDYPHIHVHHTFRVRMNVKLNSLLHGEINE